MMASDCHLYRKKDLIIKKYDQDLNQWHCKKIKGKKIIFFLCFSKFFHVFSDINCQSFNKRKEILSLKTS